ncbi:MAG: helix-turn-helix domain-containing protein [Hydrogenophilales bacterium 16-64-46]|nr:MAG: helix-turn-helix domain-containing protein [Hydrogenophilales bacterium 12-64-13]OYZ06172.1 MAG: helix-turn-helix domain-containing protein [Hydrogenophilales bacterium 16-64-46]OZA38929.1 MAG: helix-turn-helix domain-containing protein [Hydrogenophilales bacterium 17-64-34]HQT01058.1 helix-turn-helix domain-containing protein [Thiobacillus sp.]
MSEAGFLSVGDSLRSEREAQGMTLDEAAGRLRLMHRQVEAMEREDFGSLGQAVFARGFVRNYARLLGLDPEPLLAHMPGAPQDAAPVVRAAPPPSARWLSSPWLIVLLLVVLAAIAVPVALYWWLNSDGDAVPRIESAVSTAARSPAAAAPPAAPPPEAAPAAPAQAIASPAPPPAPAPVADGVSPVERVLRLEFAGESWVEIKDADGRELMRQLNPPGSRVELKGQPPFDILIGNASQVRLGYNGRPIDLTPFVEVSVARFTLEE